MTTADLVAALHAQIVKREEEIAALLTVLSIYEGIPAPEASAQVSEPPAPAPSAPAAPNSPPEPARKPGSQPFQVTWAKNSKMGEVRVHIDRIFAGTDGSPLTRAEIVTQVKARGVSFSFGQIEQVVSNVLKHMQINGLADFGPTGWRARKK